ncbi:MAG: citrate/2-methylcitrate synthase [Candidatus Hodarchaeales archaeon]|jgi:succinyl-CoA synthetase alpha subunit
MALKPIQLDQGLLFYLINRGRPDIGKNIKEKNEINTLLVGLGRQGTRHAQLMTEYGTKITCGVHPGREGTKLLETIPVYNTATEAVKNHPNIAVASIWRHFSTAKEAAIEVIETGIPIVVLITEGIPLNDVRDILVTARKNNTILFGGNTPGIIFPPENIKIGMLPDVFHPEEIESGVTGPCGVTILSRSGAILYHLSDALASAGIAQNAVLGIGGDGAIGSRFIDLVPKFMDFESTDLVVIAGEIGGMQEELLAEDIKKNRQKYSKPLIALISGANAPKGKTMGHAGAVIAPDMEYGTFISKKKALTEAGVTVINHQRDLITEVQKKLSNKTYFKVEDYYDRMKKKWELKPPPQFWGTSLTKIEPNIILIRGYNLADLIMKKSLIEVLFLIFTGEFPVAGEVEKISNRILKAALENPISLINNTENEQELSKIISTCLFNDYTISQIPEESPQQQIQKVAYILGRVIQYFSFIFKTVHILSQSLQDDDVSTLIYRSLIGEEKPDENRLNLLMAMIIACVDHGVTPPSCQTTLLLSSVRTSLEVALSGGINAITDVHGGAGTKAASLYSKIVSDSKKHNVNLEESIYRNIRELTKKGIMIDGLGHRIHTKDPRTFILWNLAEKAGINGPSIEASKKLSKIFYRTRGLELPINVDGVLGSIISELEINPIIAKAVFIFGRIIGLSAHYYEEIQTQIPMRRINFELAQYKGSKFREIL